MSRRRRTAHLGTEAQLAIPVPRGRGLDHVSFGVANRAALEEWVAHLDALDIEHSPIQDNHQPPSVTFKDPDGIALELSYPAR